MTITTGVYFTVGDWSSDGVDHFGVRWITSPDISGWDEPPDARSPFEDRDNADGQFDAAVFNESRVVTWSGTFVAEIERDVDAAIRRLQAVARTLRAGASFVGHQSDGDYLLRVKRAPSWKVWRVSALAVQYQASVVAVDPFKYGDEVSVPTGLPVVGGGMVWPLFPGGSMDFGAAPTAGRVTLYNPGTVDTWPTYVIAGMVTGGFTITDVASGRFLQFDDDVPVGSALTIRSRTGRVDINGADRSGSLVVAQWSPVPAGGSLTLQMSAPAAAGQSGSLTVSARPAYE